MCVDFVVTATLTSTARTAAADCQRMVWVPDDGAAGVGGWAVDDRARAGARAGAVGLARHSRLPMTSATRSSSDDDVDDRTDGARHGGPDAGRRSGAGVRVQRPQPAGLARGRRHRGGRASLDLGDDRRLVLGDVGARAGVHLSRCVHHPEPGRRRADGRGLPGDLRDRPRRRPGDGTHPDRRRGHPPRRGLAGPRPDRRGAVRGGLARVRRDRRRPGHRRLEAHPRAAGVAAGDRAPSPPTPRQPAGPNRSPTPSPPPSWACAPGC